MKKNIETAQNAGEFLSFLTLKPNGPKPSPIVHPFEKKNIVAISKNIPIEIPVMFVLFICMLSITVQVYS